MRQVLLIEIFILSSPLCHNRRLQTVHPIHFGRSCEGRRRIERHRSRSHRGGLILSGSSILKRSHRGGSAGHRARRQREHAASPRCRVAAAVGGACRPALGEFPDAGRARRRPVARGCVVGVGRRGPAAAGSGAAAALEHVRKRQVRDQQWPVTGTSVRPRGRPATARPERHAGLWEPRRQSVRGAPGSVGPVGTLMCPPSHVAAAPLPSIRASGPALTASSARQLRRLFVPSRSYHATHQSLYAPTPMSKTVCFCVAFVVHSFLVVDVDTFPFRPVVFVLMMCVVSQQHPRLRNAPRRSASCPALLADRR